MERDGIIRRSNSPWSSWSLHIVRKPDGSWQPCGNYRLLNLVAIPDSYPLPNILDFSERIVGCKIFSKVDCGKGPDPDASCGHSEDGDSEEFGLFEFLRMTFGLRNAGNTFQHRMDCILAGLDFVFMFSI